MDVIAGFSSRQGKKVTTIDTIITDTIISYMTSSKQTNKSSVWASQALCPRKAHFEISNSTTFDSNPVVELSQVIGLAVEAKIMDSLRSNGMILYEQAKLQMPDFPNIKLGGVIDCIVKLPDGSLKIIDVKTFGANYDSSKRVWYERQVQIYCAMTGIRKGSIVAMSRLLTKNNELQLFEYDVDTSEPALLNAIAMVAYVFTCQELDIIPINLSMNKSYCTYCTLKDDCWNSDKYDSTVNDLQKQAMANARLIGEQILQTGSLDRIKP